MEQALGDIKQSSLRGGMRQSECGSLKTVLGAQKYMGGDGPLWIIAL